MGVSAERGMTHRLQLVAVRIADIGTVVVGVIMETQSRRAFVASAMVERGGMERIDGCLVTDQIGDLDPVARGRGCAIKGGAVKGLGPAGSPKAIPVSCSNNSGCPRISITAIQNGRDRGQSCVPSVTWLNNAVLLNPPRPHPRHGVRRQGGCPNRRAWGGPQARTAVPCCRGAAPDPFPSRLRGTRSP